MPSTQRLILAFSMLLLGVLLVLNFNLQKLKEWESTTGTIVIATSQVVYSPGGAATGKGSVFALVKYFYFVDGKKYFGDRVMPLEFVYLNKWIIKGLPKLNKRMTIFYNPKDPSQSFLIRKYPYLQMSILLSAAMLILFIGVFYQKIKQILWKLTLRNRSN